MFYAEGNIHPSCSLESWHFADSAETAKSQVGMRCDAISCCPSNPIVSCFSYQFQRAGDAGTDLFSWVAFMRGLFLSYTRGAQRWGISLYLRSIFPFPRCESFQSVFDMGRYLHLLVLAAAVSATISSSGQTLVVNGISYYAAPEAVTIISATVDELTSAARGTDVDLIPLTVLADSSSQFTTDVFRSLVTNYTASDDVFNTGFLQGPYSLNHSAQI
jgi:hypothetical protein